MKLCKGVCGYTRSEHGEGADRVGEERLREQKQGGGQRQDAISDISMHCILCGTLQTLLGLLLVPDHQHSVSRARYWSLSRGSIEHINESGGLRDVR